MCLVSSSTGEAIAEGSEIRLGKETYFISGHDRKTGMVFLFPEREGLPVRPVKAAAIGAEWRAQGA